MVRLQLYPAPSTQHTRMVSQTHGQCLALKQNKGFKFKVIENQIIKELTCNMNICDGVKCWPLPGSSLYYVGLPVVRNAQLGMDDGDRVQSAAALHFPSFDIDVQQLTISFLLIESGMPFNV